MQGCVIFASRQTLHKVLIVGPQLSLVDSFAEGDGLRAVLEAPTGASGPLRNAKDGVPLLRFAKARDESSENLHRSPQATGMYTDMRTPTARSQAQLADDHTREIPKVLCIDDDPDFVNALQLRLNRFEVEVIQAFFGTQGVWLATREKPDLVITDVRMPQGGGEYVIETLGRHSETADIPIIVLTAERDCRALRRLRDLGAESCLTKPFRFAELVPRLSQYIELEQRL